MISCCWVIMNISEVPWHHRNVVLYSCEVVNHQISLILRHSARSWFTQVYRYFSSSTSAAAPRLVMKRWSQQPVMVAQSSTTFLQNTPVEPAQHAEAREQFPPRPDNQVITSAWLHSSKVFSHINQSEARIVNTSTNQKWQRVEAWDDGSSYA